jgi:hypothetical protein
MNPTTYEMLKNAMKTIEKALEQISEDNLTMATFNLGTIYQAIHQDLCDSGFKYGDDDEG